MTDEPQRPSRSRSEELTAHGRAGRVTELLFRNEIVTNKQIMVRTGITTVQGVYYLMNNLSAAEIPIWQPGPGEWSLLE